MLGASTSTPASALIGRLDVISKLSFKSLVDFGIPHLFTERRREIFRPKLAKQALASRRLAAVIVHQEDGQFRCDSMSANHRARSCLNICNASLANESRADRCYPHRKFRREMQRNAHACTLCRVQDTERKPTRSRIRGHACATPPADALITFQRKMHRHPSQASLQIRFPQRLPNALPWQETTHIQHAGRQCSQDAHGKIAKNDGCGRRVRVVSSGHLCAWRIVGHVTGGRNDVGYQTRMHSALADGLCVINRLLQISEASRQHIVVRLDAGCASQ
jgi:hypothetical protein